MPHLQGLPGAGVVQHARNGTHPVGRHPSGPEAGRQAGHSPLLVPPLPLGCRADWGALLQGSADEVTDAMAKVFVWLRYSASRQLTWQRNYNTQPRILGEAQARLTSAIAQVRACQDSTPDISLMHSQPHSYAVRCGTHCAVCHGRSCQPGVWGCTLRRALRVRSGAREDRRGGAGVGAGHAGHCGQGRQCSGRCPAASAMTPPLCQTSQGLSLWRPDLGPVCKHSSQGTAPQMQDWQQSDDLGTGLLAPTLS